MYTRTLRAAQTRLAALAAFALLAIPLLCRSAEPPPVFSPPGGGGASGARGHFVQGDGAALYRAICQGCHMADARGASGAGTYPALAGNARLASAPYPALTVLGGRHGMPGFADSLTDQQVAAVVNYVRSHFGNDFAEAISAEEVARLRATLASANAAP